MAKSPSKPGKVQGAPDRPGPVARQEKPARSSGVPASDGSSGGGMIAKPHVRPARGQNKPASL
jgi:hypothetical protein